MGQVTFIRSGWKINLVSLEHYITAVVGLNPAFFLTVAMAIDNQK